MNLLNKNFASFFLGQLASHLGDAFIQISTVAIVMAQLDKPGSAIALIFFFFLLPSLIIAPFVGILVDRFSRKRVMIYSVLYRLALISIFMGIALKVLHGQINNSFFYLYSFLAGIGMAIFYPAKMASVPNIVSQNNLKSANSLVSSSGSISITSGSVLAGAYILSHGVINCCILGIVAYLCATVLLFMVKVNREDELEDKNNRISTVSFLYHHKKALNMIILVTILSLISATFYSAMNALATDIYNVSIAGLSKLKGFLGSGSMAAIFITLIFGKKMKLPKTLVVSFTCIAIALLTASFCNTYTKALFWLSAIGFFAMLMQITIDTVLQKSTHNKVRGKIFAFKSMITTAATLLGTLIVSLGINSISPLDMFKGISFVCFVMAFLMILCEKDFRYFLLKTIIGSIFLCLYKYKVEGLKHLPKTGKCLLAGNHTGMLDTIILQMATRRNLWFITGERAFQIPIIKHLLKYFNVIPLVKPHGMDALKAAMQKLHEGEAVVIFPEGRLSVDGELFKFNKGVAYIARETNTPITPFVICGGFESWKYNKKYPSLFKKITLAFCQPITDVQTADKELVQNLQNTVNFVKSTIERRKFYNIKKELYDNFVDLIRERSYNFSTVEALSIKDKDGYKSYTYVELAKKAKNFANFMIENNMIDKGDRVAILCESRPEWAAALFASIQSGGITVPLDIKLTFSELNSILSDCLPRILCVSSHYIDMAYQLKNSISSIENVFVIDETKEDYENTLNIHRVKGDLVSHLARTRNLDETAYIVYTSGTTGSPKGVMISFSNVYSQLKDFESILKPDHTASLVSILPLNHLLELNVGLMGMLYLGAKVTYVKSLYPKEISQAMKDVQATYMIVVPLFAKMLKNGVEKEIRRNKKTEKAFNIIYKVAPFVPLKLRRIMFKKILAGFGGKLKFFISGGAPLDKETAEFFERIGIPCYQGYGLTETSPTISTNYPGNNQKGSVGKPLPSATVKIADNGEILVRGHGVMQGYYNQPEKTAEVLDEEGWFHTGDIGEIDKQGYIYITGRIKNMIVLGGGKKIFPEEVEAVMEKSEIFKELCVLSLKIMSGNKAGTEEVGLIAVPADSLQERSDKQLQKMFEDEVKRLGENLAPYKVPTTVVIHRDELPKTSTRKVKRKELLKWYEENFIAVK